METIRMQDKEEDFKVCVVTRTKNRPLFLRRVTASVLNQNINEKVFWSIVNDGGDKTVFEENFQPDARELFQVQVTHLPQSGGMERASNIGISKCRSKYVAIHDDDDSWEDSFLGKCVEFLDRRPEFVGVVSLCNKVVESMQGSEISIEDVTLLDPDMKSVTLAKLAMRNQFPPISFLFRRSAYESIDGFDEALPVLGDWDFNLRLLLKGEVGVIREVLANHHHRFEVSTSQQEYGNTVTFGELLHHEWEARYRNQKLRDDISTGRSGLGQILSLGKQAQILKEELEELKIVGDGWRVLVGISKKIGLHWLLTPFRK